MCRLEERIVRHSERRGGEAFIVSLGDMVDRGPDSRSVVRHFASGAKAGTHAALMGNHEEMMIRCLTMAVPEQFEGRDLPRWIIPPNDIRLRSPRAPWLSEAEYHELNRLMWLSQGGSPAMMSWEIDPQAPHSWTLPEDDLDFLCSLPLMFECDAAVATHALADAEDLMVLRAIAEVTPDADVEVSDLEADTYQTVMWNRRLPDGPVDDKPHVSGHTPMHRIRRYPNRKLIRVDTGACFGRRLTAWCAELDDSLSVEAFPGL